MNIHTVFKIFVIGLFYFTSTQVHAMGIGFKICLASDSSGVVTHEGAPVQGAVVQRKVVRDDEEYVDEVITGVDGVFSFSAIYERSMLKFMPIQPVVSQEVTIKAQGDSYSAWRLVKKDWDYLGEVNNGQAIANGETKPMVMRCELSDQEQARLVSGASRGLHGICRLEWEDMSNNESER